MTETKLGSRLEARGDKWMRHSRLYILPTRFGFIFIGGAVMMILIGSAYQNNLVNMLAFFMLSLVFISMLQTHNNLKDVSVEGVETEGAFAGGEWVATTVLANGAKVDRYNLETKFRSVKLQSAYENVHPLQARGTLRLKAAYSAEKRGRYQLKRARVSSVYPLGLFEAWAWFDVRADYFVYPRPEGDKPFPLGTGLDDLGQVSHPVGGDDFHGHRRYQDGDSHHHIDWKAYARGRPLLVKEFTEGAPGSAFLDWHQLEGLSTEARLSQLARWVDEAREKKLVFAMRLPNETISAGQGLEHAILCWKKLAEYQP